MYRILFLIALVCVIVLPAIDRGKEASPTSYRSERQEKETGQRRSQRNRPAIVVGLPFSGTDASNWVVIGVVVLAAGAGVLFAIRKPTR